VIGAFAAGALAGYGIAIPVGAIAVLIIETGLRRGFRVASAAGAGAATADGAYAGLAMLSGVALAALLAPWSAALRVAAVAVLVAIALRGLLELRRGASRPSGPPEADRGGGRLVATYLIFLGLTLLNPMTVAYFAALILGLPELTEGPAERVAFVAGAFLASLSWQLLLAAFGALLHGRADERLRRATSLVGHLLVLGFAIRIGLESVVNA
jgi:arginine exporter protein ArgO